MKKVNIEEVSKKVNDFRLKNVNKMFTGSELFESLYSLGISKNITSSMMKLFPYEKIGTTRMYNMPTKPIYIELIRNCYKKKREYEKINRIQSINPTPIQSSEITEEQAIETLQALGKIKVIFEIAKFAKEYPILYKKYLKYEWL